MHYIFAGKTRPEGTGILFDIANPPLKLKVSGVEGQDCELSLLLSGGIHLAVAVSVPQKINDIGTFRNQITTVCKSIYDAASYLHGTSVGVELTSLTEIETNKFWSFKDEVAEIKQLATEMPLSTEHFINLAISNVCLRGAISDLNEAIRAPNDTGFYCYRAIESLMQEFKQAGETDGKKAWPRLHQALQLTQGWLDPLTKNSKSNRHAELTALSGTERVALMKQSWLVIYRFVCLKLRNLETLPITEFPLLN